MTDTRFATILKRGVAEIITDYNGGGATEAVELRENSDLEARLRPQCS